MTKEKYTIIYSHVVDNYLTINTLAKSVKCRKLNGQFGYHEMSANDCKRYHHFIQYHLASGHEVFLYVNIFECLETHFLESNGDKLIVCCRFIEDK